MWQSPALHLVGGAGVGADRRRTEADGALRRGAMAVRSLCPCRTPRRLFSTVWPEYQAAISVEATPRRDVSRLIGLRAVGAGNQHVSGGSSGACGSEEPPAASSPTSLAIDFLTLCRSLKVGRP